MRGEGRGEGLDFFFFFFDGLLVLGFFGVGHFFFWLFLVVRFAVYFPFFYNRRFPLFYLLTPLTLTLLPPPSHSPKPTIDPPHPIPTPLPILYPLSPQKLTPPFPRSSTAKSVPSAPSRPTPSSPTSPSCTATTSAVLSGQGWKPCALVMCRSMWRCCGL